MLSETRISRTKAIVHVNSSRGTLQDTESLHDGGGHAVLGLVDVEVAQGAVMTSYQHPPQILYGICARSVCRRIDDGRLPLSLRTPVLVTGDLDFTKGITFGTGGGSLWGVDDNGQHRLCIARRSMPRRGFGYHSEGCAKSSLVGDGVERLKTGEVLQRAAIGAQIAATERCGGAHSSAGDCGRAGGGSRCEGGHRAHRPGRVGG